MFPISVRNAKKAPGGPCQDAEVTLPLALTWHVDHAAVAILYNVASLTVNPTGGDTVNRKEVESHLCGSALAPRWRQVCELQDRKVAAAVSPGGSASTDLVAHSFAYSINEQLLSIHYMTV